MLLDRIICNVILLTFLLLSVGVFTPSAHSAEREVKTIVLVTIDTLRADHLGIYGYPRDTSPFLNGLGKKGILFKQAYSQSSNTGPSHASILTSLFPYQHGVLSNTYKLKEGSLTLAKVLKRAGYETAAFTSVLFLESLREGFDYFDAASARGKFYSDAAQTADTVISWLKGKKTATKIFLWVHLWDPHDWDKRFRGFQSRAPESLVKKMAFDSEKEQDQFIQFLVREHNTPVNFFRHTGHLVKSFNTYDAQVAYVDKELERLFEFMEGRGLNENALWVITSDHGEGLGNHNYAGHSKYLYREQLHVPLIFYFTGEGYRQGEVSEMVRLVDLFPTLVEIAGISPKDTNVHLEGLSLVPLLGNHPVVPSLSEYSIAQRRPMEPSNKTQAHWKKGEVFSLHNLSHKYIFHTEGKDKFYDLADDRFEMKNRVHIESEIKEKMRSILEKLEPKIVSAKPETKKPPEKKIIKELKALGYL